jgi:tRNA threonylcarbamoyladenosine biosynthesis protein TsaE
MGVDTSSQSETENQKPESYFGEFVTSSADETFALAMRIGEHLKGGEVLLLKGDLGAGKTVFAKGLAAGLGIDPSEVTSPTFTLVNSHEGRLRLYHIDLYRLDIGAHQGLGLEEILDDATGITVIEWSERLGIVPEHATNIEMSYVSNTERRIIVSG